MANIFVSYNRQSKEIATTLVNDIESLGHTVWFDQELSGGQAWWDQILATVRGCDIFVFILDPAALASTACKRECDYAVDLGKPVLPVLVSEGVSINLLSPALSRIQFVDYRKPDRHAALLLARAFAAVPSSNPLPDPLPLPPEVPISYLGGLAEQVETTSTLSFQEQSALVVDFRRSLHDPEIAGDTRTLLAKLRKRHDLFATIAEEIDELLGSPKQAPSVSPRISALERAPKVDASQHTGIRHPPAVTRKIAPHEKLRGGLVGAVVGAVLGPVVCLLFGVPLQDSLASAPFVGAAGLIAGVISGTHRRVIVIALAGFVLGFIIWKIANTDHNRNSVFISAIALGGSIGAILGAIVGAKIKKNRGWK